MKCTTQSPKQALKAFIKQRPPETEGIKFKANLAALLQKMDIIENQPDDESEEHLKTNIRDFLRDTFYLGSHAINTKDKKDLVIHIGKTTNTEAAVIIEAKRPSNTREMVSVDNANKKALHELILYYFQEREQKENTQLKHLVITDTKQWFIIDANWFDKHIYRNTHIKKLFDTKRNDKKDNPWFYGEVAKALSKMEEELPCIYFDLSDYVEILLGPNTDKDKKLVSLYKMLSPQHLLKIATPIDSNSLNEGFYKELLHIMGLEEVREGSKDIIRRKAGNRSPGSLVELTLDALKAETLLNDIPNLHIYGENVGEQTFNIAFELSITWVNRILFLKLLESQLVSYHEGDKAQCFLNKPTINDFQGLFTLFHKVLAVDLPDRSEAVRSRFRWLPYLNSSLFEISVLEAKTIKINSLENAQLLELMPASILKNTPNIAYGLPTVDYLFMFLDAYDFASEGGDDWEKEKKQLINASVLGKVFEKINGYRDGSIFTPAFITMYMCRESIRLAVVDKFNQAMSKNGERLFNDFEDVKNHTRQLYRTNEVLKAAAIVNSLHICDPAVGSGHFLVSALNEIIAIKWELGLFADENGVILGDYVIEIVNDELIITYKNSELVEYRLRNGKPLNKEVQLLQKTLFQQKQAIIENCLFGVDINPKSVLICRLRLWIELLKNAYYKEDDFIQLETLPNIDINIKCGNSLLGRFPLDADLTKALKSIKYDINAYRGFVHDYKNERNREVKLGLQKIIDTIKSDFRTEIFNNDPRVKKLNRLQYEYNLLVAPSIFGNATVNEDQETYGTKDNINKAKEREGKLAAEINNLAKEIEEAKNNKVYNNAFEWRFEFPEVLNNDGSFAGFDLIIGNPPYIKEYENKSAFNGLRHLDCYQGKMDLWYLFGDLGLKILKPDGYLCLIATNNWVTNSGASKFRNIMVKNSQLIKLIDFGAFMVFDNASIQTMVMLFKNTKNVDNYAFEHSRLNVKKPTLKDALGLLARKRTEKSIFLSPFVNKELLIDKTLTFNSDVSSSLLDKIKEKHDFFIDPKKEIAQGIVPNPDVVNADNITKLPTERVKKENIKVGDGVFIVDRDYFPSLSETERKYIKPLYEPYLIDKYFINGFEKEIIYIKKKNFKNDAPTLIKHLGKFREIMEDRRENQQGKLGINHLHWPRNEYFFEKGEKVLCVRKCEAPTFAFTDKEAYVMMSFYVIRTERINLKYLTALLNSKLIAFWLRKKGKMQGNNYQLDKEPLLEIPILKPNDYEADAIAKLVDDIISLKQQGLDSSEKESEIDKWIYSLYGITETEQKTIEE